MTPRWYVVCRFTSTLRMDGEYVPFPASVAHAKQMGGSMTACGQNVSSWVRLFHVEFPFGRGDNCPLCLDAVVPGRGGASRGLVQPN